MELVKAYTEKDVVRLVRARAGEAKFGDKVFTAGNEWRAGLRESPCRFVIIGIPEDIGVRANYGRGGTHTAVKPAIESFLNQQANTFADASSVYLLGEVFVDDLMVQCAGLDPHVAPGIQELRKAVEVIDGRVAEVIRYIISLHKIPVVIGGGHNNSYGNIKGAFQALNKKINVINCDAHLDFRAAEGRHSGNGFSYAFHHGFLERYAVVGVHEQYNNAYAISNFRNHPASLYFNTYEQVAVRGEFNFRHALENATGFVKNEACGIEIDLDVIANVPSSARSSSGISVSQARQYIHHCAVNLQPLYLHIAEGAPVLAHLKADNKTGKLIAYLITDFIKACAGKDKY
jgi:formiminoglutamase